MTPLTPNQVIDLVVETYVKHPEKRSVTSDDEKNTCWYNGPDGKHCAFAMFVSNPEVLLETERAPYQFKFTSLQLKPEVAHITDPLFWAYVQGIHDGAMPHPAPQVLGFSSPKHRIYIEGQGYIPERVEKYVTWLKHQYAAYNPSSIQSGE